jgi:hypothetical protein
MPRPRNDHPRDDFLIKLPRDLARDLDAYCRANEDAARVVVVRKAIRSYIDWRLETDGQLRQRFEASQREPVRVGDLRVIRGDKTE